MSLDLKLNMVYTQWHTVILMTHSLILFAGGYLVRCGLLENKIAAAEETLQGKVLSEFITPLKAFLEVDIKNVLVKFSNCLIYT